MNYFTEISNRIATACGDPDVAMMASSPSGANWTDYHIFDSNGKFIQGMNRGRVPFICYWRVGSDYSFDAVTTNDQGGMLTSRWNIEVVVGKSSRLDDTTNEEQAYGIAQKIMRKIRENNNLCIGNESIGTVETHPFGYSLIIDLTIENTHSSSDK